MNGVNWPPFYSHKPVPYGNYPSASKLAEWNIEVTMESFGNMRREAQAVALEDAAEELAKLQYVRPESPDRAEYERMLAIRRGDTDKWLRARAKEIRGGGHD